MKGSHTVKGVVVKNYIGSSFTGTPTQNYIVELENPKVKCIVYTKLSKGLIWEDGEQLLLNGYSLEDIRRIIDKDMTYVDALSSLVKENNELIDSF